MFYSGWTGSELPTIPDNNYDAHHFASVDNNGNVIGYISYRISWITMSADNFGIISFGKAYELDESGHMMIGGQDHVHIDAVDYGSWLEITKKHFEEYFELLKVE